MTNAIIHADELRQHPVFAALNDEQLKRVIQTTNVVTLDENQPLFQAGQEAKHFFLVRTGRIKLFLASPDGNEKVIHLAGGGATFAEAIMFMDSAIYPVNASALIQTELLAFSNKAFREILRESVDTCFRLLADMSTWLKKQLNEIDALTLQNATLRFSNYLLQQIPAGNHNQATIELEAPKNIIASRLSIQPESFSRILRNMQRDGLITINGNMVTINDPRKLRAHVI